MNIEIKKRWFLACTFVLPLFCSSVAWAQTQTQTQTQSVLKLPELRYLSVFETYQPYANAKLNDWKQANDTVKEAGGWRAYAKEMAQDQGTKPVEPVHSKGGQP